MLYLICEEREKKPMMDVLADVRRLGRLSDCWKVQLLTLAKGKGGAGQGGQLIALFIFLYWHSNSEIAAISY